MNNNWIQTLISFTVLLLLQEFLFNNIQLGIYINIYIYVMFILLLPTTYSPLVVLLLSGIIGLTVDVFSGSIIGLNMAACLAMGFFRTHILKMITTSSDTPQGVPVMYRMDVRKVLVYTALLVLIHHSVLFSLEAFSLYKAFFILIRTVVSTIIVTIFIIVFEMFLYRK